MSNMPKRNKDNFQQFLDNLAYLMHVHGIKSIYVGLDGQQKLFGTITDAENQKISLPVMNTNEIELQSAIVKEMANNVGHLAVKEDTCQSTTKS